MMAFTLNEGQGSLFPNDHKSEDRHPDMTGRVNIDGRLLSIAGWNKTTRDGTEWLSLQVSEPRQRQEPQASRTPPDAEDDTPF